MNRFLAVSFYASLLAGLVSLDGSYAAAHTLVEKSPFLPPSTMEEPAKAPQFTPVATVVLDPSISFHGVISAGGESLFSMHDAKTNEQKWCSVGDEVYGYVLVSYDATSNRMELAKGGKVFSLYMDGASDSCRAEELLGASSVRGRTDTTATLIKYSSLSPQEQRAYYNPESISILEKRSIEVPPDLRRMAASGAEHTTGALRDSRLGESTPAAIGSEQPSSKRSYIPKRYPTPRVNTGYTRAEREAAALAAQGG